MALQDVKSSATNKSINKILYEFMSSNLKFEQIYLGIDNGPVHFR